MPRAVVLVGPRASGKTTIGRALAGQLGWPLIDADQQLAAAVGESAGEHLRRVGEPGFRKAEEQVTVPLLDAADQQVLALGGGAVLSPMVRDRLLQADLWTAFLFAPPDQLVARIRASAVTRPPLTSLTLDAEVRSLFAARLPHYREVADATFDTAGQTAEEVADAIAAAVTGGPPA